MFTGLVEAKGIVNSCKALPGRRSLRLEVNVSELSKGIRIGGSLCVNGVCLTVIRKSGNNICFDLLSETKKKSNLPYLKKGDIVNLELPLKAGSRLEGHLVQGHVEGVGMIRQIRPNEREKSFLVSFPIALRSFIFEKGSIALNGVSLTIGKVRRNNFWVHCVSHTLKSTNFKDFQKGTKVNLETDILAKMAARGRAKVH